jgi:hypothetical protein
VKPPVPEPGAFLCGKSFASANVEGKTVAKKTIRVSDESGNEIPEGRGATVRITFADARKGVRELDLTDAEAERLGGRAVARRGRKPAAGYVLSVRVEGEEERPCPKALRHVLRGSHRGPLDEAGISSSTTHARSRVLRLMSQSNADCMELAALCMRIRALWEHERQAGWFFSSPPGWLRAA